MKKTILLLFCSAIAFNSFGQSDVSGPGIGHQRQPGRFVGWSPTAPGSVPGSLEIRNDFNFPMTFHTNGVQRARIFTGPLGGFAINSLGNTQITPGSLLSIGVDRTGYSGWRSWMYEGMSVQANSDNMYVGLKYEGANNRSDAVIVWGNDNDGLIIRIHKIYNSELFLISV